jgi:hypothetical protein
MKSASIVALDFLARDARAAAPRRASPSVPTCAALGDRVEREPIRCLPYQQLTTDRAAKRAERLRIDGAVLDGVRLVVQRRAVRVLGEKGPDSHRGGSR